MNNCYNFSLNHKIKRYLKSGKDAQLIQHIVNKKDNPKYIKAEGNISHKRAQRLLSASKDVESGFKKRNPLDTLTMNLGTVRLPGSGDKIKIKFDSSTNGTSGFDWSKEGNRYKITDRYISMNSGDAPTYLHELSHHKLDPKLKLGKLSDRLHAYGYQKGQEYEAKMDIHGLTKYRRLGDWSNKRNNPTIKGRLNSLNLTYGKDKGEYGVRGTGYEGTYHLRGHRLIDVEPYRNAILRNRSKHEGIQPWMKSNLSYQSKHLDKKLLRDLSRDNKFVNKNTALDSESIRIFKPIDPIKKLKTQYSRYPSNYKNLDRLDDYRNKINKRAVDVLNKRKWY